MPNLDLDLDEAVQSANDMMTASTGTSTSTAEPAEPELGADASASAKVAEAETVFEETGDTDEEHNESFFEQYKLPLIAVGSALAGVLAALGAVAGAMRLTANRRAAAAATATDYQHFPGSEGSESVV